MPLVSSHSGPHPSMGEWGRCSWIPGCQTKLTNHHHMSRFSHKLGDDKEVGLKQYWSFLTTLSPGEHNMLSETVWESLDTLQNPRTLNYHRFYSIMLGFVQSLSEFLFYETQAFVISFLRQTDISQGTMWGIVIREPLGCGSFNRLSHHGDAAR
jgi:hypothetical protein